MYSDTQFRHKLVVVVSEEGHQPNCRGDAYDGVPELLLPLSCVGEMLSGTNPPAGARWHSLFLQLWSQVNISEGLVNFIFVRVGSKGRVSTFFWLLGIDSVTGPGR